MPVAVGFAALAGPGVVAALCLYILCLLCLRKPRHKNLPPGPKGVPVLGNIHQLPRIDQHIALMDWANQYGMLLTFIWWHGFRRLTVEWMKGDVVYAEFFSQPTIILSSAQAAVDLLEKRGAKYSDRPALVYFRELCVHR